MPTELEVDNRQLSRAVGAGDRGWGAMTPAQILADQFTLSQGGGADYAHTTLLKYGFYK